MAEPQKAHDVTGPSPKEKRGRDYLFSLVYEELRRLASYVRKKEAYEALNSTALVHEAWVKLKDSPLLEATSLPHFKAIAANAMRQVLVDEARRRESQKRGGAGAAVFVPLDDSRGEIECRDDEVLSLNEALEELGRLSPRQAKVVVDRFFGGMSVAETAEVLGVSESAVERDWRAAKAWLARRIRPAD